MKKLIPELTPDQLFDEVSLEFPRRLHIEPTNACNLNCSMCPRSISHRNVGYMNFRIFKKIIDECKNYRQMRTIDLQKDGEPLLHPELFDFIKYAKAANVCEVLRFGTNGVLLSSDVSQKLIDLGLDMITISLDGATAATYEKIRRNSDYEKVKNNILGLMEAKRKSASNKPHVRVQMIDIEQTRGEQGEFFKQWEGKVDEVKIQQYMSWQGHFLSEAQKKICKTKDRFPCVMLWQQLVFNWDGTVSICPIDFCLKGKVGDINTQSIKQIWDSDKMQRYRIDHLEAIYRLIPCRDCDDWKCIKAGEGMWTVQRKKKFIAYSKQILKQS